MRRLRTMLRDPVIWILVVAGVMEIVAGGTVARGAMLFGGAAIIFLDHLDDWRHPTPDTGDGPPSGSVSQAVMSPAWLRQVVQRPFAIGLAAAVAIAAAGFEVHSAPLTVVVGLVGVLMLGWAWMTAGEKTEERPSPMALLPWALVVAALGIWELVALGGQETIQLGSYTHPTISFLLDPVFLTYPGRVLGLVCWLWLGRSLVRRA